MESKVTVVRKRKEILVSDRGMGIGNQARGLEPVPGIVQHHRLHHRYIFTLPVPVIPYLYAYCTHEYGFY